MRLKVHVRFLGRFEILKKISINSKLNNFFSNDLFLYYRAYPTKPGHFSRTLSKGPNTTTWIWNLHADAHDFDTHTTDLQDIARKIFSAHFGQLGIILCDRAMGYVFA